MAIEVRGLVKSYRAMRAVDDISFHVDEGSIFAFLGSNGAGKSTTIACLTTLRDFDAGTVRVTGHDVRTDGGAVRQNIGVVFQDSLLDPGLTARENLQLRATLSGLSAARARSRVADLTSLIGLEDVLDRRYARLSGGQRRRVDIARALLHDPRVLFLDEPTAGLDPASRAAVWGTVQTLRVERGLTVFLTTHYMEETEEADRVCVLDKGRIVADDTAAALRARYGRSILTVTTSDPGKLERIARALHAQTRLDAQTGVATILVPDSAAARHILTGLGEAAVDFEFRHGRMDDVFLALTGHSAQEGGAA